MSVKKEYKTNSTIQTNHETSMTFWARKIKEASGNDKFVRALLDEETSKPKRLSEMSLQYGLPIYENHRFMLPTDTNKCLSYCSSMINDEWVLSIRIMELPQERLIFRQLDTKFNEVERQIFDLNSNDNFIIQVSPYKHPSISGSLWVSRGDAYMELVFGSHTWLTKSPPADEIIYSCYYKYNTVKYSSSNPLIRNTLFCCLRDVLQMVLGVRIRQLSELPLSTYTEFHWSKSMGYRFLECSFSPIWTNE